MLYHCLSCSGFPYGAQISVSSDAPMKTAYATIKGFEAMRAMKKKQTSTWQYQGGVAGEVRLVERMFGVGKSALEEVAERLNRVLGGMMI